MTIHNVQGYPLLSKTYIRVYFWNSNRIIIFVNTKYIDMNNKTDSISPNRNFPGLDDFLGEEENNEVIVQISSENDKEVKDSAVAIEEKMIEKPKLVAKEDTPPKESVESSDAFPIKKEKKSAIERKKSVVSKEIKECHILMPVEGYNELIWFSRLFNMKLADFILFLLEKEKPSLKKEILKKFGPSNQ